MKKFVIPMSIILLLVLAAVLLTVFNKETDAPVSETVQDSQQLEQKLRSITLDVQDFGGTEVVLENGENAFPIIVEDLETTGFVGYANEYDVFWREGAEVSDVYAVYYINGGGTGTFPYLFKFSYDINGDLHEEDRVNLGDRIAITDVHIEQTEPNDYQVWVSLTERLPREGMAAPPSVPMVLHFFQGLDGLVLGDIAYGTLEKSDIGITEPLPQQTVGHTFTVRGEATGPWYFEAVFPITVENYNGEVIAQSAARAHGDWMTTELVPFEGEVTVPSDATGLHFLILEQDNPSGEPQFDRSIQIPILIE